MYQDQLKLPLLHAGKIRELYAVDDDRLLMVATDKISAFDFVLEPTVPDKGAILNQLSLWWFDQLADVVDNHVLSTDVPAPVRGRAVICERLEMIPVECVARGYLTGSGWVEYQQSGTVCGIELPAGLVDGSRLPEPIFTPATKAALGEHDENVDFATVAATVGHEVATRIRELTLAVYAEAEVIARERGLILADTKFEFGTRAGRHHRARRRGADAGLHPLLGRLDLGTGSAGSTPTTSSSSGTGCSTIRAGTDPPAPHPRRCHPRWWPRPGRSTSRPTNCSPEGRSLAG